MQDSQRPSNADERPEGAATSRQSPHFLQLSIRMVALFVLVTALVVELARGADQPPNPFRQFQFLFEKRSFRQLEEYGFACEVHVMGTGFGEGRCYYDPDEGPFSHVCVTVIGGRSDPATFVVQENALRAGELELLWGQPQRRQSAGRPLDLYWPARDATVGLDIAANGEPNGLGPLQMVSSIDLTIR